MNNSPSVGQLGVILARFLHRYHITLYTMTIVIAVSVAIFLISSVTSSSDDVDAKVITAHHKQQSHSLCRAAEELTHLSSKVV